MIMCTLPALNTFKILFCLCLLKYIKVEVNYLKWTTHVTKSKSKIISTLSSELASTSFFMTILDHLSIIYFLFILLCYCYCYFIVIVIYLFIWHHIF